MRARRVMLGLTQQQLADLIGVTYQQAHKYESGLNRIAASRLWDIAGVLGVPVGYFFEGLPEATDAPALRPLALPQRQLLELARHFCEIEKPQQQQVVCDLARVLAQTSAP